MKKRFIVFAVVTLILGIVELACAHYLAAHDAIQLFISLKPGAIVAALAMMSARLCRYLILPGWGLYLALTWARTRVQSKRANANETLT